MALEAVYRAKEACRAVHALVKRDFWCARHCFRLHSFALAPPNMPPKDKQVRKGGAMATRLPGATPTRRNLPPAAALPPRAQKKKKAKPKAPAYLTDAASLQPFGVQVRGGRQAHRTGGACLPPAATAASLTPSFNTLPLQSGQLVKTQLGCTATVLGLKASAEGGQLWVRYASGQEAPLDRCVGW